MGNSLSHGQAVWPLLAKQRAGFASAVEYTDLHHRLYFPATKKRPAAQQGSNTSRHCAYSFSKTISVLHINVKVNYPPAGTACLHPTRTVSVGSKQPDTGEVSAANEQTGRCSRSGRAVGYSKPPLGRAEQRSSVRIKALALFERSEFASVPNAASSARDRVSGTDVARLFFGYFLLAKQQKETRPPGRDPACHRRKVTAANQTPQKSLETKYLS